MNQHQDINNFATLFPPANAATILYRRFRVIQEIQVGLNRRVDTVWIEHNRSIRFKAKKVRLVKIYSQCHFYTSFRLCVAQLFRIA